MSRHSDAFIQLDRTFSKILLASDATDDTDLGGLHGGQGELSWLDLLGHNRVVLLSEAGSGKTAEIRNVALELRSQGKSAFFLRIENVTADVEDAFEVGTHEEFEAWIDSGSEGWLLMDSPGVRLVVASPVFPKKAYQGRKETGRAVLFT
ncbi:hypothetical protein DKB71_17515 [Pseudomonas sp. PLMAX]